MCKSEPQIAVEVTRTMASRGSRMRGCSTSSTCMCLGRWYTTAFMAASFYVDFRAGQHTARRRRRAERERATDSAPRSPAIAELPAFDPVFAAAGHPRSGRADAPLLLIRTAADRGGNQERAER